MDYSLLIMVAARMMKMAIGDDFPHWWSAEMETRLIFHGYGGLWRWNFCSRVTPRVLGIFGNLEGKEAVREATEVGTPHRGPRGTP